MTAKLLCNLAMLLDFDLKLEDQPFFYVATLSFISGVFCLEQPVKETDSKEKNTLNKIIVFSGTKGPMSMGLDMQHWQFGPYQVCSNKDDRLTLTYFMARSNMLSYSNAFILEKS